MSGFSFSVRKPKNVFQVGLRMIKRAHRSSSTGSPGQRNCMMSTHKASTDPALMTDIFRNRRKSRKRERR